MKLKKAINRNRYSSLHSRVMMNVVYTSNWFLDRQNKLFKEHGLLSQHYSILRILRGALPEPVSPGKLKEAMLDKCNDLTRLINKLVTMGLVTKHICPINKRKVDVEITQEGLLKLEELDKILLKEEVMLASSISEVEADFLNNILDKIRKTPF